MYVPWLYDPSSRNELKYLSIFKEGPVSWLATVYLYLQTLVITLAKFQVWGMHVLWLHDSCLKKSWKIGWDVSRQITVCLFPQKTGYHAIGVPSICMSLDCMNLALKLLERLPRCEEESYKSMEYSIKSPPNSSYDTSKVLMSKSLQVDRLLSLKDPSLWPMYYKGPWRVKHKVYNFFLSIQGHNNTHHLLTG